MRTFVILGIILVVVSIVIAKFALEHESPAASAKDKDGADISSSPERIACWGFFEVRGGVAQLDPKQAGDIVFVTDENAPVKSGDLLLQVDDELAQLKVKQAKAAVDAANLQVSEAEKLTDFYRIQRELQDLAIQRVEGKIRELKLKKNRDVDLVEAISIKKKEAVENLYKEGFALLDLEKKAEEAKLRQVALQDASLKIDEAKADMRAKNLQLQEAKETLKNFKITAPSDGSILRANYHKGEIVAPNPLKHAIEFLPKADIIVRAEVLQEWGRFVKEKQEVEIADDTYHGPTWKGEVESISKWYASTRSPAIEPFRFNDVRTLEIIIKVWGADNVKIGQRVRAMVKIK